MAARRPINIAIRRDTVPVSPPLNNAVGFAKTTRVIAPYTINMEINHIKHEVQVAN